MPDWWRWFSYADFASHIVRALTVDQFHCDDATGATCATITVTTASGAMTLPTYMYMQQEVGATYGDRWRELGIAAGIVGAIMAATVLLHRLNWQRR
jgi:preprotein translocase subunit SecD